MTAATRSGPPLCQPIPGHYRGRQSGHFLEIALLHPPLAALRRFPRFICHRQRSIRSPHRPGRTGFPVMRRAGWSCCGAQNFCAALRRTLEILTAATRSFRFIRHRRRSIHSPHPAAMVRSLSCGGTHGCRPTERFAEADDPVRPAPVL